MKKVFLIHGFKGEANGGWRPKLMSDLAHKGIWACALSMPNPSEPKKSAWVKEITRIVGKPNKDIFLVGHSLGVPAILRYLESISTGIIGGAVLVSGPTHALPKARHNHLIAHFVNTPFDFKKIKKVCKKFVVIHGDNDTMVPFHHAEELADSLSCRLISIPNGGHLGNSAGYYDLPEALQSLEQMVK